MNIGRLRHRVTFQQLVKSRNTYGETVESWETYATRWAEVKPVSGNEYYASDQVVSTATTEIWLRFMPDIKTSGRVIDHRKNTLDIVAVQDVRGRGTITKLLCKEVT